VKEFKQLAVRHHRNRRASLAAASDRDEVEGREEEGGGGGGDGIKMSCIDVENEKKRRIRSRD
jgi:hypothetical protein